MVSGDKENIINNMRDEPQIMLYKKKAIAIFPYMFKVGKKKVKEISIEEFEENKYKIIKTKNR